jgi:hypothetical protein
MGGQSVVMRAEKGKVRMLLDKEERASQKELVYDVRKDIDHEHSQSTPPGLRPAAEDNRDALDLKRDERGLAALLSSLADQPRGRPSQPVDLQKQALEQQLEQAHRDNAILQHKMALQEVLTDLRFKPGISRWGKIGRIERVVALIAEAKTRYALPIRALAAQMRLSVASLARWRRRLRHGQVAVGKRDPRKVKSLNLEELKERISGLEHGKKCSRGSGPSHRIYSAGICRRELNAMVRQVRYETNQLHGMEASHVTWLRANLAWAMDDRRKTKQAEDGSLHLHNLTDLHSRQRLPPLASDRLPCGEEVTGHLQYLFERFDPALFCKGDSGRNLNHPAVNQVLEEALVIPINSPPYRPPYNGGIEQSQGKFKSYLARWSWKGARSTQWRCSPGPPPMT